MLQLTRILPFDHSYEISKELTMYNCCMMLTNSQKIAISLYQ